MVPSSKWFPSSLQERAAWFNNFNVQFPTVATFLGFLPADTAAVSNDNEAFQYLASSATELDSFKDACRQYRVILTEGAIGTPPPDYPTNPTSVPSIDVPTGIFERLDNLVKRIRVAPAYTDEIGVLLGIIPQQTPPTPPDELKPDPSLTAMPGNIVEVSFTRGKTDGLEIQMKLDNEETWTNMGRFLKSPAIVNVPANGQNTPRAVQIRARYVLGNNAVGMYSDIDEVSSIS